MPRPSGRRRPRLAAVLAAVLAGIVLGVAIDVLRVGGLEAWLAERAMAGYLRPPPPYEAMGRLVQVDGRDVYVDCRGSGSPTVLLEAGFGSGASGWGETLDGIAAFTRVCAWDRPGIGRSEPRGRHSAAEAAADLRAALDAAGEQGPFVVVAHSLGGVYARVFAEGPGSRGDVLAYLMVDTYDPDIGMTDDPSLPPDTRDAIRRGLDSTAAMIETGEELDWARTLDELAAAGPADIWAIRLTANPMGPWIDEDPAVVELLRDAWRRAVDRTYPNSRYEIAAGSGHMIQWDRPDLVIDRTRELVELARSGGQGNPGLRVGA